MNVYPSILTDELSLAQQQLDRLQDVSELISGVQIDVIDGQFVDNLSITPIDLLHLDTHQIPLDFHLMVDEPIDYVYECGQIEGSRAVIAQIEHMSSQVEFIQECLESSLLPGLSLDLYTPVSSLDPDIWDEIRVIQVMANKAGVQGQAFAGEQVLKKIRTLAEYKKERDLQHLEILVDIGVSDKTVDQIVKAGATGGAPGSFIWKSSDIVQAVSLLQMAQKG